MIVYILCAGAQSVGKRRRRHGEEFVRWRRQLYVRKCVCTPVRAKDCLNFWSNPLGGETKVTNAIDQNIEMPSTPMDGSGHFSGMADYVRLFETNAAKARYHSKSRRDRSHLDGSKVRLKFHRYALVLLNCSNRLLDIVTSSKWSPQCGFTARIASAAFDPVPSFCHRSPTYHVIPFHLQIVPMMFSSLVEALLHQSRLECSTMVPDYSLRR